MKSLLFALLLSSYTATSPLAQSSENWATIEKMGQVKQATDYLRTGGTFNSDANLKRCSKEFEHAHATATRPSAQCLETLRLAHHLNREIARCERTLAAWTALKSPVVPVARKTAGELAWNINIDAPICYDEAIAQGWEPKR